MQDTNSSDNTVQAYTKINQFIQSAEKIGAFSGYVRRPQPHLSGMVAQFFGPNGEDSDSILALSLTKYLDAEVFVTVYFIKDGNGVVMKQADGSYPKIAQFMGIIRRATPNKGGMMAQFFAGNGKDSDAVTDLGKSLYQDSLVYVDIRGKYAQNQIETLENPQELIDNEYVARISQHEIKEYQKKEKQYKKLNEQLILNGFLKQPDVLYALGSVPEFVKWSCTKGCCWPTTPPCLNDPVEPYEIKTIAPHFNFLPFCQEHIEALEQDINLMPMGQTYMEMKHSLILQEWAREKLREKFALTNKLEPDSAKIAVWARQNKLDKYLPAVFNTLA